MSKLEHRWVNLRHIQHHAAQLADRRSQPMSGSSGFKLVLAHNGSEGTSAMRGTIWLWSFDHGRLRSESS
jgi:hypothetical protein